MSNEFIDLPKGEGMDSSADAHLIPRPETLRIREELKKKADEYIKEEKSIEDYLKTHTTKPDETL